MAQHLIGTHRERAILIAAVEDYPKWKDIPSAPGYQASSVGQIRSLTRRISRRNSLVQGRILRQWRRAGRCAVSIGRGRVEYVDALVLLAFKGPSDCKITHINGNKLDNRLSNLCYGEPGQEYLGRCGKGHELIGDNVALWGSSNRICRACQSGVPANRTLPEVLK